MLCQTILCPLNSYSSYISLCPWLSSRTSLFVADPSFPFTTQFPNGFPFNYLRAFWGCSELYFFATRGGVSSSSCILVVFLFILLIKVLYILPRYSELSIATPHPCLSNNFNPPHHNNNAVKDYPPPPQKKEKSVESYLKIIPGPKSKSFFSLSR